MWSLCVFLWLSVRPNFYNKTDAIVNSTMGSIISTQIRTGLRGFRPAPMLKERATNSCIPIVSPGAVLFQAMADNSFSLASALPQSPELSL
jgi:hypothetical protein